MIILPKRSPRSAFTAARSIVAAVLCTAALAIPARYVIAQTIAAKDVAPAGAVGQAADDVPASMHEAVPIMIELEAPAAGVTYAEALKQAHAEAEAARQHALANPGARSSAAILNDPQKVEISAAVASQVQNAVASIDAAQQALLPSVTAREIGATVLYRVQRSYNGIAVSVSPDKMDALKRLPGVKSVRPIQLQYPMAFQDIDFVGIRSFWTKNVPFGGAHGENVKVAIIDTGIDYVHTNFGGPGTADAYSDTEDKDPAPNAYYPNAKVAGGFDFAGDAYDAGATLPNGQPDTARRTPNPDPNPMDTNGHGTSCASLTSGYGLNFGGSTYFGPYDDSTPINGMKISPGYAPGSELYALRVFGTTGSTALTPQALEWALDPNGDGDFSDKMDVINMSLGSNQGHPEDASSVASSNAAAAGILVVASAGNSGDTYYNTGAPGVATGILSVAATFNDQSGFVYNATVTGNSENLAGRQFRALYANDESPRGPVTGDVVQARPATAATPLTNASSMAGKICLVERGGGFAAAANNCQAAGAIAIIIYQSAANASADPVGQNTAGATLRVPDVMINRADGLAIVAAANFDATTGVPATPTNVTIGPDNGVVQRPGVLADTMPGYSARGPRPFDSALKPDIAAPAEVVGVASKKTGNGVQNFNGTSSAAPHVAGMMALLRQQHPDWTVQELNAVAANTATNDLFTSSPTASPSPSPNNQIGVSRAGHGRINGFNASQANVVAYNESDPGNVGVSFGVVEVPVDGSVSLTKQIRVVNKGASSVTYNLTYQDVVPVPGASFSFPGDASITIPAGASASVPVQFSATGNQLMHVREASVSATQAVTGGNLARHWLTEAAGYAVLNPTAGSEPAIRVALYSAPKPVAAMRAAISGHVPTTQTGSFDVPLTGAGINTGSAYPRDIVSLGKLFELQYASPLVGGPNAPIDQNAIKHVGVTSDYANPAPVPTPDPSASPTATPHPKSSTVVMFAIDNFGNQSIPAFQSADKEIFIDTNRDGTTDYVVFLDSRARTDVTGRSNVYAPVVVNRTVNPATAVILGLRTNGLSPETADTNIFNNSVHLFPVPATSIGLIRTDGTGPTRFNYSVATFNRSGALVDRTPVMTYDLANPGFTLSPSAEPSLNFDLPGGSLPVGYNGTNYQTLGSLGVMMVHLHNGTGQRSDVVTFRKPSIRGFSPTSGPVGTRVTINGANFNEGTSVTFSRGVQASSVNVLSSNVLVATVPPDAVTGSIRVSNAAGTSVSQQQFTVTPSSGPPPAPAAIAQNLSTRLLVQRGDEQGITGLIITGAEPKRIIIRALGPSLRQNGVTNPLADPVVQLHGSDGQPIAENDNWRDTQEADIKATGIPPTDDAESAILLTLAPGSYTAVVGGKNQTTGVGLVEVYDLDSSGASHLGNISTRGSVQTAAQTGTNLVIGGFMLGRNQGDANIILRGIGPSLARFGISNPLADPTLQLHDGNGGLVSTNDDWQDDPDQAAQLRASGIPPEEERESAITVSLPPGSYTAILAGRNGGTGIGLVEVFTRE